MIKTIILSLIRFLRDSCVSKLHQLILMEENRKIQKERIQWIAKLKRCGDELHVKGISRVSGAKYIEIGNNVHIGENAFIRGDGGLKIGDNTHISRNLVLYTINHRYEGDLLPYDNAVTQKPVIIGRNVWIGMNVCIAPGSTIGDGAIVGMGAVIAGNVPPLSIVGSQKFRILGCRNAEHYEALDAAAAYGGANGMPLTNSNSSHHASKL